MVPTVLLVCWCFCLLGPLGEMSQHRGLPVVKDWNKIKSLKLYNIIKLPFITYYQIFHYIRLVAFYRYSKSSIKPPLSNKPSVFRGGKLIRTPPPPPPFPPSLFFTNNLRGLISYGLFVRLKVHNVLGLRPHDLQFHVLNFFNFTL